MKIGNSVTSIGNYAFEFCDKLSDIYSYMKQLPDLEKYPFEESVYKKATLHVSASVINDYKSTEPWSKFKEIVALAKESYTLYYYVDGEIYRSYSIEEGEEIIPEEYPVKAGHTFSGWSEIPKMMPAKDVIVNGSFIQYVFDVGELKCEIENGQVIISGYNNVNDNIVIPAIVKIENKTYAVIAIAEGAFENCADITSVEIPDGVETIGANAFAGCINLNMIILGSGVTNIGSKAFANIGTAASRTRAEYEGLKVICNALAVPNAESDAFEGTNIADALLLVDDNLVTQYQTTAPWSGFGKIYGKEAYTGINDIWAAESSARIYDLNGNCLSQPQRGVNIIRMGNGTTRKVMVK